MHIADPRFPPLFKGHALKAPLKPLAEAARRAKAGRLGAGDLLWSRNTARAELAMVLEPEVPLGRAVQMAPLMMVALGDCLGTLCAPQLAIHYRWPGGILLNGTYAGEIRIAAPNRNTDELPAWLVVGVELDIAAPHEERTDWSRTSLAEEAGSQINRTDVLQSLASHFLVWLNTWQDDGFRPVHAQWFFRSAGREEQISVRHGEQCIQGMVLGLDEDANLLLQTAAGRVQSVPFLEHVITPE